MLNGKNAFPNVTYEDFLIDVINFSQYFSTKHSFMEHFVLTTEQSHGEDDAYTSTYQLDFKLLVGSDVMRARNRNMPEVDYSHSSEGFISTKTKEYEEEEPDETILLDIAQLKIEDLRNEVYTNDSIKSVVKASNITSYEVINGYELDERNIFELDTITEADFEQEWRVFKAKSDRSSAMNEYYKLDSEGESKFAHKLENNENVLLFTKLKKGGFVIDTPYGNYSPDWAVVCRKEALKDPSIGIYFIVETKAGKTWADLTDVEKNKIHCGELHFKAVSDDTKFDWVNGYEDFVNKFGVAESD